MFQVSGIPNTYGIASLRTDTRLTHEERDELYTAAIRMNYSSDEKREVKGNTYQGNITFEGRGSLGHFGGNKFKVEVDKDGTHGVAKLEFIVCDLGLRRANRDRN